MRHHAARPGSQLRLLALIAALALAPAASRAALGTGNCTIPGAEATTCAALEVIDPLRDHVYIQSVSGDGSTLVGSVGSGNALQPARWVDGVLSVLPLPPGFEAGEALVTSHDGKSLAGVLLEVESWGGPSHYFHWDDSAGYTLLGLPAGQPNRLGAMSPDGRVVVGAIVEGPNGPWTGFRWNSGVLQLLGDDAWVAATTDDVAVGVNGDGAVKWDANGIPTVIGTGEGGPSAISPDGTILVGTTWTDDGERAVRWDDGEMTLLAHPAGMVTARAGHLDRDGSLIAGVGQAGTLNAPRLAFLWQDGVPRQLVDVLQQDFGITSDLVLHGIGGVSEDGRVLIGSANNGYRRFVAVLSPKLGIDVSPGDAGNFVVLPRTIPLSVVVFGSDQTEIADLDPGSLAFGPGGAAPVQELPAGDANGDGLLDRHFQFDAAAVGLPPTDTRVCLTGRAAGSPFRVCSHVTMRHFVGCGIGFELALLLPPLAWAYRRRRARA